MHTEEQGKTLDAAESSLGETATIPLPGMPFEGRALRLHTDRGMEWLSASFRLERQTRNIVHTCTQGCSPPSNETAERFVGLMPTVG